VTVLLVDGRSGSGKTELARAIVAESGTQLLRLDDLYPGWGGLAAGSAAVHESVLRLGRWRRWDWAASAPAEWHDVDLGRDLVIEGCGALSRANRALATSAVWVELDEPTRRRRALARDGEMFAPHWDEWAAQEDTFIASEGPRSLADEIVDGTDVAAAASRWAALLRV
jgi:predicted kinase